MKTFFPSLDEVLKVLPEGRKITLVGGCFDLLHVGHLHVLSYAATLGDVLVVAVNSDSFVRNYKGPNRPIVDQGQRATMVASITGVDFVYITDTSSSSLETLKALKPDNVVFGQSSEDATKIKKRVDRVRDCSPSTKLWLLPRYEVHAVSTSSLVERIKNL